MRTRYKKWAVDYLREHPEAVLEREARDDPFLSEGGIYCEIGAGKGGFLTALAQKHPERRYLAVEKVGSVAGVLAKKAVDKKLTNVRVYPYDAFDLPLVLRPGSLAGIYLNFPDPWPKKRHAKRRLTSAPFLAIYNDLLAPGGKLTFKSDSSELYAYTLDEAKKTRFIIFARNGEDVPLEEAESEYETRFKSEGKPLYNLVLKKE